MIPVYENSMEMSTTKLGVRANYVPDCDIPGLDAAVQLTFPLFWDNHTVVILENLLRFLWNFKMIELQSRTNGTDGVTGSF